MEPLVLDSRPDALEVPKFKPLKGKRLRVLIIDKGFKNLAASGQTQGASSDSNSLNTFSELETLIYVLTRRFKPDFATEDIEMRTEEEFFSKNPFARLFSEIDVPFIPRRASILDYVASLKEEVRCIYLCITEHIADMAILFDSLGADVLIARLQKEPANMQSQMVIHPKTLKKNICSIIRGTAGNTPYTLSFLKPPYTLIILGADEVGESVAELGYEAGFDLVLSYGNPTPKDVERVIEKFSLNSLREPERTCVLICTSDVMKVREFLQMSNRTLNRVPIMLDPGGEYSLAVSMVERAKDFLKEKGLGDLLGKRCAVFGTGTTGKIVSVLLHKMGCRVTLVNLDPTPSPEYTGEPCHPLNKYMGSVESVLAPTTEDRIEILRKTDVVFVTVPLEDRITFTMLRRLRFFTLLVDVRTSSPTGVWGLEPDDEMREILLGTFGLGGLALRRARDRVMVGRFRSARLGGKTALGSLGITPEILVR